MTKLLREPLVHFLLLGAMLFGVFAWKNRTAEPEDAASGNVIHVGPAEVQVLVSTFEKTWQRPPTHSELEGLVKEHLNEEIFYREARTLGLDQNDIVIRRRLRQKMEFLTADVATAAAPGDAELEKYFAGNADRYAEPPRVTFSQVFFNRTKRGDKAAADAAAALAALRQNPAAAAEQGDPSLLPADLEDAAGRDVSSQFGDAFAAALQKLPLNEWQGPVESAYGWHLVRITARGTAQKPELATVREAVLRDYVTGQREELNRCTLDEFRDRYRITVDENAVRRAAAPLIAEDAR